MMYLSQSIEKVRERVMRSYLNGFSLSTFAHNDAVVEKALTVVSYIYYVAPFAAALFASADAVHRQHFDPLWPLFWVDVLQLHYIAVLQTIILFLMAVSVLGACAHQYRFVRVLVFIAFWQAHALESSFGSPNHQWYLWVYVTFLAIFLPDLWTHRKRFEDKRQFLLIVWAMQAFFVLIYTLAGFYKFVAAFSAHAAGHLHTFSSHAFAYQVADWLPKLQQYAYFGGWVIEHPYLSWPLYVAVPFLQVVSLWVLVRPSLQKVWVSLMALFHMGVLLTMGISFHPHLLLLLLLFFNSPFYSDATTWREILLDVPVVGWGIRRLLPRVFKVD